MENEEAAIEKKRDDDDIDYDSGKKKRADGRSFPFFAIRPCHSHRKQSCSFH